LRYVDSEYAFAFDSASPADLHKRSGLDGAVSALRKRGRNSGFLNNYVNKPTSEIERGIRSIQKQIDEHTDKIADPESHIEGWENLDPRQQQALLNSKWPGDIARQQAQLDILREILENR